MIPIKNKKKTLKITVEEMRNFSLSYVEKYSPSRQQIKTLLIKCKETRYHRFNRCSLVRFRKNKIY